MFKAVELAGYFVAGVGALAYLHHKRCCEGTVQAEIVVCEKDDTPEGRAAVPKEIATEGPLTLQLKQVHVIFRHGARTPLRQIPKITEADYDPELIMREHLLSLYPYKRVSCKTGEQAELSDYDRDQTHTVFRSGVCAGALTSFGKEQMYMLGHRLKTCYMDPLDLATYSPVDVFALSSNITRTVESARGVLAGFFGKEQLQAFAENCHPVNIYTTDKEYNIIIPEIIKCGVVRKAYHTSMNRSDSIPGFMDDRLKVERSIDKEREKNICLATNIQEKITNLCECFEIDNSYSKMIRAFNEHRQPYLHDPVLQPLIEERSKIMAKVDRIWIDAMVRNPSLAAVITEEDMKALIYLRRLEVERFAGKFRSGYRIHFYFDSNPYFHNKHLCKEVYTDNAPGARHSWSIPIVWKKCGNPLLPRDNDRETACSCPPKKANDQETDQENEDKQSTKGCCDIEKKKIKCADTTEKSFFHWYVQPTCASHDYIGNPIKDVVWVNPILSLENERTIPDKWGSSLNFDHARDDLVARMTLGYMAPKELTNHCNCIIKRATTMLYYAMTGLNSNERCVVTRLTCGPFLTFVVDEIENKIRGMECTPKLCLYAVHDSTMASISEAFGWWADEWPPFGSEIRMEIYKDINRIEYYVRFLHQGEVKKIRGQKEDFMHWCDFKKSIMRYMIHEDEFRRVCCSNILDQYAKIFPDNLTYEDVEDPPEKSCKPACR